MGRVVWSHKGWFCPLWNTILRFFAVNIGVYPSNRLRPQRQLIIPLAARHKRAQRQDLERRGLPAGTADHIEEELLASYLAGNLSEARRAEDSAVYRLVAVKLLMQVISSMHRLNLRKEKGQGAVYVAVRAKKRPEWRKSFPFCY